MRRNAASATTRVADTLHWATPCAAISSFNIITATIIIFLAFFSVSWRINVFTAFDDALYGDCVTEDAIWPVNGKPRGGLERT